MRVVLCQMVQVILFAIAIGAGSVQCDDARREPACGDGSDCCATQVWHEGGAAIASDGCGESLFGCIKPLSSGTLESLFTDCSKSLAESGIAVNASLARFYMGVVDGGTDQSWRYGGHGDYVANVDGDKLFGAKGLFIKLRAEHRYGESTAGTTGALLPSSVAADLPVPGSDHLCLTNMLVTQMFSESFGVFFGKLDTFDGDQNAFASGRGVSQFSNVAFVATPIGLRTIPIRRSEPVLSCCRTCNRSLRSPS